MASPSLQASEVAENELGIPLYRPYLIQKTWCQWRHLLNKAFEVAERELGIPALLDPEDMVSMASPDKLSILTYLSQYYNFFKDKKSASGKDVEVSDKGKEIRRRSFKRAKEKENKAAQSGPLPAKISLKSDKCEICGKRVYLVERQVVDGRLFHRNCFRCTKCRSTLRPDSYKLTKDPKKFECMCHSDNGDIWNLRMNVTSRAGARLAGVAEEGGTIWQNRTTKAPPKRPDQPPPKLPPKATTPAEPAMGNSKPSVPPVAEGNKPAFPGSVPLHPHLLKSAARARFHPSGSPVSSPQLQRHPFNGSVSSLATQRDTDMAASQETLDKSTEDSPARPVPLPRSITKPKENGEVSTGKDTPEASTEKSTTESSREESKVPENGDSTMFSTDDDESKSSEVRSLQEGESLGFESSDLDNINDSFNQTFRDTDDATSAEESTAKVVVATAEEIKEEVEDSGKEDSQKSEEPVEVSLDQNEDVSVASEEKDKEEETMNTVNVAKNQEKTDLEIVSNDVTNKSVEEGSTGDSALWDTKVELSDSFQDENGETKKAEEDIGIETSEKTVENDNENEKTIQPTTVVIDERTEGDKDSENKLQENESQLEDPSGGKTTVDYDDSLNPFGSDDDVETEEPPKRQSTNPFDSDEDDDGYDNSLNPFGDEEEEEGEDETPADGSVNPFTGSPIEETPFSLRLKGDIRAASFSHPRRPERPPPPILSSGSYSVKTRSQILEELKRDRETLKKKRAAPPPPPGGSPGGVTAPPRSRKSRKAPQPPQVAPKAASDGELPNRPAETKNGESTPATPVPQPRKGPIANGTKQEPVPSPRMKKVQKFGQKLPITGMPLKQVDLKNIELKKVQKPPSDFRKVELRKVRKPEDIDDRDRDGDDEMEVEPVWVKMKKDFDVSREKKAESKQLNENDTDSKGMMSKGVTTKDESQVVSFRGQGVDKELRDEKASDSLIKENIKSEELSKTTENKSKTESTSLGVSQENEMKPKVRLYMKRDEQLALRDEEMQELALKNEKEGVVSCSVGDGEKKEEVKPKDLSLNIVPLKPKQKEEDGKGMMESKVTSGPKIGSIAQSSAETDDLEDIMKNVMEFLNLDFEFEKKAVEGMNMEDLEDKVDLPLPSGKMEMKKEKTESLSRSKESKRLLSDGEEDDDVTELKVRPMTRRNEILSDDEATPVPAPRKKRYHRRHSQRSDVTVSQASTIEDEVRLHGDLMKCTLETSARIGWTMDCIEISIMKQQGWYASMCNPLILLSHPKCACPLE
ncbi:F-actin-monooxygenase MICAL3-like [Lytechinus pictus]|uniref:F-actin-monooxygenase MICAL3-like n=1 Tax=Lytechinus pictus TaxID=7653 RepID=UPI0030B9CB32